LLLFLETNKKRVQGKDVVTRKKQKDLIGSVDTFSHRPPHARRIDPASPLHRARTRQPASILQYWFPFLFLQFIKKRKKR
jgi:hypothetical protein